MIEEQATETKSERQVYELGYHLMPTIAEDDVETHVTKIRKAIEARSGNFIAEGTPESVSLSYPMVVRDGGKRTAYERAHFGWIKFDMDEEAARLLQEEDLSIDKDILRFRLIKTVREDTRAQVQVADAGVLREVETTGTIERKTASEDEEKKGEEVSEAELEKSIDELVGETEEK